MQSPNLREVFKDQHLRRCIHSDVDLTLQNRGTEMGHRPRAQFRAHEVPLDFPGETDDEASALTDLATIRYLLFISQQHRQENCWVNRVRRMKSIQLQTEYTLLQIPFVAAHENGAAFEKAAF